MTDGDSTIQFRREPISSLALLAEEWRTLERVSSPSFFTSWHWIGTFVEALPEAARPQLLRGLRDGETVALALCGSAIRRRAKGLIRSRALSINETGQSCFDCITIEHNSLLTKTDQQNAAMAAALKWFAGMHGEVDELRLPGSLRPFSPEMLGELQCSETKVPAYSLDLSRLLESQGQISVILSPNARRQLRQSARAYTVYGPLSLQRATTLEEAFAFFAEMKALHCQSWARRGKRHAFTAEFFEEFHRLLIRKTFDEGLVELLRLTAGDRVLGILYNFWFGSRVYAYQSGFAAADRRQRPGMLAHALAIQRAFAAGAEVYDFMAGENRLKQRFSTCCMPMFWQTIEQRRISVHLEKLARNFRDGVSNQSRRIMSR